MTVTRFAPSPTGHLHLGHAYSALFAYRLASEGQFILRIEDIDPVRSKPEFMDSIFEDLRWLGLRWREPVRQQSQHLGDYADALAHLRAKGLLYPCFCSRRTVASEAQVAVAAPHAPEPVYSGTCRSLSSSEQEDRLAKYGNANWRLHCARAKEITGPLFFFDRKIGPVRVLADIFGDVVIARKDVQTSYHLSVTVDDHLQKISLVTRGEDLLGSTHIHRTLQSLLGYSTPEYSHHCLLVDEAGKRFAKRDAAVTLQTLRLSGMTPSDVMKRVSLGLVS